MLLGSAAFTVAGLALVVLGDEPGKGIAAVAFFGLCTAVGAVIVRQRLRMAASAAAPGPFDAPPGPIREARLPLAAAGGALAGVGALLASIDGFDWPWTAASAAMALGGLGFLVALAVGRVGDRWLRFERDGLRVADRLGSVLLPWDDVAGCQLWSVQSNVFVSVSLHDPARTVASAPSPAVAARFVQAGAVRVSAARFGWDAVAFARCVEGYARDPARRAALPPG